MPPRLATTKSLIFSLFIPAVFLDALGSSVGGSQYTAVFYVII